MQQGDLFDDDVLFVPAATMDEAAARLFSLTGARDPGTRGPKRSLEALATDLGVGVDLAATNAVLGGQIAQALSIGWRAGRDFIGLQVTLDGLNKLLRAATRELWLTSRRRSVNVDAYVDVLRAFPTFRPAMDKQEAVDRLSNLAGVARDRLGPGGKEHRVTFDTLAQQLAPDLLLDPDARRSKHTMVAALCQRFSVPWLTTAGSTGQSVTLEGLNLLLAGAERHLSVASLGWGTPEDEGSALLGVLRAGLAGHWDGRHTVERMHENGSRNWRQMEWPGFYFEEQVATLLNVAYPTPAVGGPRRTYGATPFDYASSSRVWDAKAHTVQEVLVPSGKRTSTASGAAILNDSAAITACLAEQGLGFLILDGAASFDETGQFDDWHRDYTREGRTRVDYVSNSGRHRRRKSAFEPMTLRALWIADLPALNAGIAGGWISREKQGAQQVRVGHERGADRHDKFHLKVHKSAPWTVAQTSWTLRAS
ncbi:hypothetical protein [Pengzhenrongella sicca]|uniref:Uncharacterized protein n=1 Tax=Pengzhenrongella sicca TaxID=2819238 RepID=A0A8A4ZDH4_9MICO|nr:hypothetical protein [Pengzhenrongella sicca]QTE30030.1 hypothetical protein J4E96_03125 [Pengzhenrongella sicca]